MRWKEQKNVKNIPDIIDCDLKKVDQILLVFGRSISDTTGHKMTVQVSTSPNVCFCTTCKKTKQAKYGLKWTKNVNKFHLSGSVASNSPDLSPFAYDVCGVMQQRIYRTPFRNVDELKKWLVEVWSRTLLTLLSMNGSSMRACGTIFWIFSVSSWTTGQLDKLSARVTEIWTKCALCVLF